MYKRELQDLLVELNKKWSVISVTGPRQSGKTTMNIIEKKRKL